MNTNYEKMESKKKNSYDEPSHKHGRSKLHNKDWYLTSITLKKGQEFQIELFNPTNGNMSAKLLTNL
jgi:hypothetical protein